MLIYISCLLSFTTNVIGQSAKKINISVRDKNKKPASETFVELVNANNLTMVKYAITGDDGSVEFDNVKNGNYIVFIPQINGVNYISSVLSVSRAVEYLKLSVTILKTGRENGITVTGKSINKNNKIVSAL